MSTPQLLGLFILGIPVALYTCVVIIYAYVRATTMNEPEYATPPIKRFLQTLISILCLLIIVFGLIPLGEMVYDWAFAEEQSVRVSEVAPLDGERWWYVGFASAVECEGHFLLLSTVMRSQPSPDCDGTPTREMRFLFGESVPDGAAIVKIEVQPEGSIRGIRGEDVDLAFEYIRFSPS